MSRGAIFSECGKYRYQLWRIWDESLPLAMLIGLNPSRADSDTDDRTISNIIRLIKFMTFGGFIMTNLYAFITPYPDELWSTPNPLKDNDKYLIDARGKCSEVIYCWGSFRGIDHRARQVAEMFPGGQCFRKNKNGSPIHPLYLKRGTLLMPYK